MSNPVQSRFARADGRLAESGQPVRANVLTRSAARGLRRGRTHAFWCWVLCSGLLAAIPYPARATDCSTPVGRLGEQAEPNQGSRAWIVNGQSITQRGTEFLYESRDGRTDDGCSDPDQNQLGFFDFKADVVDDERSITCDFPGATHEVLTGAIARTVIAGTPSVIAALHMEHKTNGQDEVWISQHPSTVGSVPYPGTECTTNCGIIRAEVEARSMVFSAGIIGHVQISGDGRYVVLSSQESPDPATVPEPSPAFPDDYFLYRGELHFDLNGQWTGAVTWELVNAEWTDPGTGYVLQPVRLSGGGGDTRVSHSGQYVVFMQDLTSGQPMLARRDMNCAPATGCTDALAPVSEVGSSTTGPWGRDLAMSADGRYVAHYWNGAGYAVLRMRDMTQPSYTTVTVFTDGGQATAPTCDGCAMMPTLSADAQYLGFHTMGGLLPEGYHVAEWQNETPTQRRGFLGQPIPAASGFEIAHMSANGRWVAINTKEALIDDPRHPTSSNKNLTVNLLAAYVWDLGVSTPPSCTGGPVVLSNAWAMVASHATDQTVTQGQTVEVSWLGAPEGSNNIELEAVPEGGGGPINLGIWVPTDPEWAGQMGEFNWDTTGVVPGQYRLRMVSGTHQSALSAGVVTIQ